MKNTKTPELMRMLSTGITEMQRELESKNARLESKFLGDAIVYKDGKYLTAIPRQDYLMLANKVKEFMDLAKALEAVDKAK